MVVTIVLEALQFFEALDKTTTPLTTLLDKLARLININAVAEQHGNGSHSHGRGGGGGNTSQDSAGRWRGSIRNNHSHHNQSAFASPQHPHSLPCLPSAPVRPIKPVLSEPDQCKKDFLAQLNKLTASNEETITKNLKTLYTKKPEYIDVYIRGLWSFMLRQPDFQQLHIQVLTTIFPKDTVATSFKTIYEEAAAAPNPPWNEQTPDPNTNYDLFCDYVKWKGQRLAAGSGWMRLILNGFLDITPPALLEDILRSGIPTDCIIEQLSAILGMLPSIWRKQVRTQVSDACVAFRDIAKDRCKFKLLDLEDLVNTAVVYKTPAARRN